MLVLTRFEPPLPISQAKSFVRLCEYVRVINKRAMASDGPMDEQADGLETDSRQP